MHRFMFKLMEMQAESERHFPSINYLIKWPSLILHVQSSPTTAFIFS